MGGWIWELFIKQNLAALGDQSEKVKEEEPSQVCTWMTDWITISIISFGMQVCGKRWCSLGGTKFEMTVGHPNRNGQCMSGFSSLKLGEIIWAKDTDLGLIQIWDSLV